MDSAAVVAPVVEQVQAVADTAVAVIDSAAHEGANKVEGAVQEVKNAVK